MAELADPQGAALAADLQLHQEELKQQNEELRRVNAQLRAARARTARLFDSAPNGYVVTDARGRIVEANATIGAKLAREREALLDVHFDELLVAGDRQRFRHFFARLTQGEVASAEFAFLAEPEPMVGRVQSVLLSNSESLDGEYLLAISDETERRRIERARRVVDRKFAELARLESLSLMAAGVAHDLNNLLAILFCQLDFAAAELGPAEPARLSVREAKASAERAALLARQLQAYSGQGRLQTVPVDVRHAIQECRSLLEVSVAHRASLSFDLEEGLPPVLGDVLQLQQVVINLVLNAAEAMATSGGHINVSLRLEQDLDSLKPGGLLLRVADDGPGMDETTRARVFDPFFSTKATGRGLGLAVVFGNVRAHQGTVEVTSAPGEGTTFRIVFPAIERPEASAPSFLADALNQSLPAARRVLVVDDEPLLRAAIVRTLHSVGISTVEAGDGPDGLEALDDSIDAILLDMTMPRMGGGAVLEHIRASGRPVPTIIMSGYAPPGETDAARAIAQGFLQKPFGQRELLAALAAVLAPSEQHGHQAAGATE